jgi:alpha-amylase
MRSTLVSVSLTLLAFAGFALSADADAWRTRSVYQIMTDRFARPDGSTTAPCNTTAADYCGGTWRGIIDKLDYIQGMGFTAVWISPITAQINQTTPYGQAYTGYWQNDMYAINDIWGTTEDLKDLAKALHDRDMYFMVDTIVNNFAYDGPGNSVNYALYNPFNNKEYFHNFCLIQNYSIYEDATQCWMGDNTVSLPDLRTEDPDVVKMFQEWIPGFVQNFSIDGLRIDAVKQVDRQFFPYLLEAAGGLYAVGEEYEGDTNAACEYQNYMPGITNYPAYFPALRAFQNSSGSMDDLAEAITDVSQICGDSTLLGSFSENHDVPRFASYTQDLSVSRSRMFPSNRQLTFPSLQRIYSHSPYFKMAFPSVSYLASNHTCRILT